jgi:lysine 2,3-aminomutase
MKENVSNERLLPLIQDRPGEDDWASDLKAGASGVDDLVRMGYLSEAEGARLAPVTSAFRFRVGRYYLSLIDWSDPNCPIRKQAIPSVQEVQYQAVEMTDPIGDDTFRVNPLLIHRYPDRVLLTPTLNCPMYCRYCFRKVGLNTNEVGFNQHWDETLTYLGMHPEIEEVILSGGDPLLLGDGQLHRILNELTQRTNIERIRIHSRVPVTLPQRLTNRLLEVLSDFSPLVVVAHFNHPKELTPVVVERLKALQCAGVTLSNQSVLLKGVNDTPSVLRSLCATLLKYGVIPHYLHHPDLTVGTDHLRISLDEGRRIYATLRGRTSGLAIPTYVMEIPDGGGKIVVDGRGVKRLGEGSWALQSPRTKQWSTWHDPAYDRELVEMARE